MKKVIVLLIVLLTATTAFAVNNPWDIKLPFKNATISYTVDGKMKGTKTVYIKDYGRTTAEYTNTSMSMFGMKQHQKEILITTPDWEYSIDLSSNSGTKQANPKKYLKARFNKLSKSQKKKVVRNAEKTGVAITGEMGGNIQKKAAKLLGYKCDKVTMMGVTAYTISGTDLPLKTDGNVMGIKILETATRIKKGKPSASKFKVPSGIRIEHDPNADQMLKEQADMVIQNLLAGKSPAAGSRKNAGQGGADQLTPEQQQQMQQMMKMFGQ